MRTSGGRSVVDFDSEAALRKALMAAKLPIHLVDTSGERETRSQTSTAGPLTPEEEENLDWVLPSFDPETTEPQSMQEELHRLQVLKSYMMLDAEREECFDRLTRLGARYFNVPICVIGLIDLGRQWFVANRGLGDARESTRKDAICAHTIMSKKNLLVVPDTTKDFRFKNNPYVAGPPAIRFYAGVPLVSPEGYKLGTFCIDDFTARPDGLSKDELASLRDFADLAVKDMVKRKSNLNMPQNPEQLIAYTAHDLMTPLTGVHLSLSLLKSDEEATSRLGEYQQDLISTASHCSDLMVRICQTAVDTLRGDSAAGALTSDFLATSTKNTPVTKISDLTERLVMIMKPIPKTVPVVVTVDSGVPSAVMSDELKLFRSALNLLTNGVDRTTRGLVQLRIFVKPDDSSKLVFECTDTGGEIPVEEYQYLFRPNRGADGNMKIGLNSVATMINFLDGEYGFFPLEISDGYSISPSTMRGSVFWFSVPLFTPENFGVNPDDELPTSVIKKIALSTTARTLETLKEPVIAPPVPKCSSGVFSTPSNTDSHLVSQRKFPNTTLTGQVQRKRRALIIEDSLVVRKSLARALEKLGMVVAQAVNGLEGLQSLKSQIFDFVLCDFLMPVMDGLDCVQQYRDWEKQHRPDICQYIVGISAHGGANDGNRGIKAGMNDFKPKPVSIKVLTEIQKANEVTDLSKKLDELEDRNDGLRSASSSVASLAAMEKTNNQEPSIASEVARINAKRQKMDPGFAMSADPKQCRECLLAINTFTQRSNHLVTGLEEQGWKVIIVHDGQEALRHLKMHNWNAVLLDDDLPFSGGARCAKEFRFWEQHNRINRQRNLYLVCKGPIPSVFDKRSTVQAPTGFDGVLGNPVEWKQLDHHLLRTKKD
ncbi:hypothetical protein ACA910_004889 [Epithemia clementina (nom. ined.)]